MSLDLPDLPDGWSFSPLESCAQKGSITYGVVQPGSPTEDGVPIIRVNNFRDTRIDVSDVMKVTPEIAAKYERTRLKGGEVLLTVVGTVGQVAVAPSAVAGYNVARAVAVIHPLPHVSAEWIALCLRSPFSQHLLGSRANTTVQTTINLKDLRALPIPLPPEGERVSITAMVGAIDERITLLRETNATLEAIAHALFKSWFVDFDPVCAKMEGRAPEGMDEATAALFPDSFEESELGLQPKGWLVKRLDEISEVGIGKTPPRKEPEWFSDGSEAVRWVSIRDMGVSGVYIADTAEGLVPEAIDRFNVRRVPDNTVLLSFKLTVGRVSITDGEMTTNEAIAHCKLRQEDPLPTEFIYLYLKQFDFGSLGSTSSIAEAVNSKTIKLIPIIAPSNEVVSAFHSLVSGIFQRLKENERQAKTLTALRDTLLPRLISGQLRLSELTVD